MKSSARRFGLAVLLFSLAGCGLKGPLYLPDDKQQQVPPSTAPKPVFEGSKVLMPAPAPQAQKKDRGRTSSDQSTLSPAQPSPVSPPDPDRSTTTPPPPGQ
jgi:predicted small lipoprotein YifL